ncbi:MAG: hypothetical protein Q8L68_07480 [Methylococcales bacterium]|nr:hypothetical protein [Methylococcales bacterium]
MPLMVVQDGVVVKSAATAQHNDTYHLTTAKRNAASGVAGLGSDGFLLPENIYPHCEEYHNHLGAVDNFTATAVCEGGTATSDAANHKMDLSTGLLQMGTACFYLKSYWTPGTKQLIFTCIPTDIQMGTDPWIVMGLGDDLLAIHAAQFGYYNGIWYTTTANASVGVGTPIAAINNGDVCEIVVTSSKVRFYVNGILVATHTTGLPSEALRAMCFVHNVSASGIPTLLSVDYISIKRII